MGCTDQERCVDMDAVEDANLSSIRMIPTSNPNPIPESIQSKMKRSKSFGIWDRPVPRPPTSKFFKFQIYRRDFNLICAHNSSRVECGSSGSL